MSRELGVESRESKIEEFNAGCWMLINKREVYTWILIENRSVS